MWHQQRASLTTRMNTTTEERQHCWKHLLTGVASDVYERSTLLLERESSLFPRRPRENVIIGRCFRRVLEGSGGCALSPNKIICLHEISSRHANGTWYRNQQALFGNALPDLRPCVKSTNCSHVFPLCLGFHYHLHKFFEILGRLDGALEGNISKIVVSSCSLA